MSPGTIKCKPGSVLRKAAMMETTKKKAIYKPLTILSHPPSVRKRE
jgi:hypothetical protein